MAGATERSTGEQLQAYLALAEANGHLAPLVGALAHARKALGELPVTRSQQWATTEASLDAALHDENYSAVYKFDPVWSKFHTPEFYKLATEIDHAPTESSKRDLLAGGRQGGLEFPFDGRTVGELPRTSQEVGKGGDNRGAAPQSGNPTGAPADVGEHEGQALGNGQASVKPNAQTRTATNASDEAVAAAKAEVLKTTGLTALIRNTFGKGKGTGSWSEGVPSGCPLSPEISQGKDSEGANT